MIIPNFYIKICTTTFVLLSLSACDMNTMQPQDVAFVHKIERALKVERDRVRVAKLHEGDWQKVCFTTMGAKYDAVAAISEDTGIHESELEVINRPKSEARHGDDFDWGIYFFYTPNKIEYYEISLSVMAQGAFSSEIIATGCAKRDNAYFVADEILIQSKNKKILRVGLSTHST